MFKNDLKIGAIIFGLGGTAPTKVLEEKNQEGNASLIRSTLR